MPTLNAASTRPRRAVLNLYAPRCTCCLNLLPGGVAAHQHGTYATHMRTRATPVIPHAPLSHRFLTAHVLASPPNPQPPPPPRHHHPHPCQVVWRRISTASYAAFVCRVLGWPPDASAGLERHVATRVIAVALVRGHDPTAVPRAAAQRK